MDTKITSKKAKSGRKLSFNSPGIAIFSVASVLFSAHAGGGVVSQLEIKKIPILLV